MQQIGPEAVGQVFECLKAAQSPHVETQKNAEAALDSLTSQIGFCSCLAVIVRNKQADHSARWLASILFKNTVARFWKPRPGQGGISEEEKVHLRATLLQLIDQESSQIAVPIAVAVAKVARVDYPKHWPRLFEDLLGSMNPSDTLRVRRVYLVLHHILKELSSMRLPAQRETFSQVAGMLFDSYWKQWCSDTQLLLQDLPKNLDSPQPQNPLVMVFERWFMELKGIGRMLISGQESDTKAVQPVAIVSQAVPMLLEALVSFAAMRPEGSPARTHLLAMLERALVKLAQSLTRIQDVHPWSFYHSSALERSLSFFTSVLLARSVRSQAFERFLMQSMIFLHQLVNCKGYKGNPEIMGVGEQSEAHAARVKKASVGVRKDMMAFWQAGNGRALLEALVQVYLPLTDKDLQDWDDLPEEFYHQADAGTWQDGLRSCAESLLISLLTMDRDSLAPVVLEMLRAASAACPPGRASSLPGPRRHGIPEAVLAKEAVYNAVGVASWDFLDQIDFKGWLHSALLPELEDKTPENMPVRRRVGVVIGQWVPKLRPEDRPAVYRAMLELVADDDFVLALVGVQTLHDLVSDWDFVEEQFLEFVGPCLQLLAAVLNASAEIETQIQVFNLLNLIFDRLADSVRPFVPIILALMPDLWQQSEDHSLLRIQILLGIQKIVNALGPESPSAYPLVLPILQHCTDPSKEDALNLVEDGLQLWVVTLRNAMRPQQELLDLFPNIPAIMHQSTEHIRSVAQITVSLILLGGRDFLASYGTAIAEMLASLIGTLTERGTLLLMPILDVVIQMLPNEGPPLLELPLRALLQGIQSGKETGLVVPEALGTFARVLLHNHAFFPRLFSPQPPLQGAQLGPFLETWLDKFDSIYREPERKLAAMGLCVLLRVTDAWILHHITPIVANLTAVCFELRGEQGDVESEIGFHGWYTALESGQDTSSSAVANSDDAAGEYSRKRELHEKDPVNVVKLSDFIAQQFEAAAAAHGSLVFNDAINRLDPMLKSQLQSLLGRR